jgi:hypothetical protein
MYTDSISIRPPATVFFGMALRNLVLIMTISLIKGDPMSCIPQNALCDPSPRSGTGLWAGAGLRSQSGSGIGTTTSRYECCPNTTCELIPGLNVSMCTGSSIRNNCVKDADCSAGLACLVRLGKCGICSPYGQKCTLPFSPDLRSGADAECCSGYCALYGGEGICSDPKLAVLRSMQMAI